MKRQDHSHKKGWFSVWIMVICVLIIIFTVFCIMFLKRMDETADKIYEHPYTVSSEARSMQSRLMDMRLLIGTVLLDKDIPSETFLDERYRLQDESLDVITEKYLGPQEDSERLAQSMKILRKVQDKAIQYTESHSAEETNRYVSEYVIPCYDNINEYLNVIISSADGKMIELKEELSGTARQTSLTFVVFLLFILSFTFYFWHREKKNMEEIQYRDLLFECLGRNIDDAFVIYNAELKKPDYISENTERVLGLRMDKDVSEHSDLYPFLSREDQEKVEKLLTEGIFDGPKELEFEMMRDGERHYMKMRTYPECHNGKVVRYIVLFTDQTGDYENQLVLRDALVNAQNANAAKSEFLSRMSHEIRTPMNAVIGMTAIAAAHIENRARVENCLNKIGHSSKHLMSLINDVLDMSKIEEGKLNIAHETFQLSHMLEGISAIVYPQAEEKGVSFKMPLVGVTEEFLFGDTLRLRQIFLNLLSNALKFTPEGGEIRLEIRQLRKRGHNVRIRFTVSDTGIGMSKEFMERLFMPFEQEDMTVAQRFGGTGLGLSITKNLVTLMGGVIHAESERNRGSVFSVELDFEMVSADSPYTLSSQEFESLKVLVADDDADTCEHTTLLLDKMGIHAQWVLTGVEAVDAVSGAHERGDDFDVCFIDWKMPDIDGIETTRRIREMVGPETLIIIITAYDWESIEHEARNAGANLFLAKPIFASALYEALLTVTRGENTARGILPEKLAGNLTGKKILLAEDNILNREIAEEILNLMGITADCAMDGRQAVDMFTASEAGAYDAVLMDIQMPVMDGYRAAKEIRNSAHPEAKIIPVIAMTANAFQEDIANALAAGMNAHIAKPIDPPSLYRTLAQYLC